MKSQPLHPFFRRLLLLSFFLLSHPLPATEPIADSLFQRFWTTAAPPHWAALKTLPLPLIPAPAIRNDFPRYPETPPLALYSPPPARVRYDRLAISAGGLMLVNYFAYQQFKNMWWNYPTTDFHLYRGWRQTEGWYDLGPHDSLWLHIDKLGHFYNTRLLSLLFSDTALWIGYGEKPARWIGALTSWLLYLQIELFDGRFEQWGFSLGDMAANTAGAFMPLFCASHPVLQKFTLKFSYFPSPELKYVVEDYAGMTFWLTANPQHFLPKSADPYWPDFLNLALGYGITHKAHGQTEFYVGLDYDLTAFPGHRAVWNRLLYYLNFIHLPAPAVRCGPTTTYNLFYY